MKDNPPIICKKIYEENDLGKGIDILHKGKAFNILWNKIYKTEIIKKIIYDWMFKFGEEKITSSI